jgi:hypothetical protein
MNLNFSTAESAFRAEVRSFVSEKLAADIRRKVMNGSHLTRDDHVLWQRTLNQRGWGARAGRTPSSCSATNALTSPGMPCNYTAVSA